MKQVSVKNIKLSQETEQNGCKTKQAKTAAENFLLESQNVRRFCFGVRN